MAGNPFVLTPGTNWQGNATQKPLYVAGYYSTSASIINVELCAGFDRMSQLYYLGSSVGRAGKLGQER